MIDEDNPKYKTVVNISTDKKSYILDTNKCEVGEEITCPTDKTMRITKKADGCVIIKKLSRLKPF